MLVVIREMQNTRDTGMKALEWLKLKTCNTESKKDRVIVFEIIIICC